MNVLSLFDGMSCGQIALNKLGIRINNYYASEINKHAIKCTNDYYPNTIQLGDIENWREWDIDWFNIDLIIAGSLCQGFSYAGKQLVFDDPRSKLFFIFVDILEFVKLINPDVKFQLENVKMKGEHKDIITSYLNVEPVHINSGDYTPCERPRNYWYNWDIVLPDVEPKFISDIIDFRLTEGTMSDGWHIWWVKNRAFQIKKKYSKICFGFDQFITMTARQYASWNGNFIPTPCGKLRRPTKRELALLVGAPVDYFDTTSQKQAEEMTGNGWSVDVICLIFKGLL